MQLELLGDNKEEFCHLETYPHHHHDEQGNVKPSRLTGDPLRDIEIVLHTNPSALSSQLYPLSSDVQLKHYLFRKDNT